MPSSEEVLVLVYYPGHLGEEVVARLRGGQRGMKFRAGQVRAVPVEDAADLTHPTLGGYYYVATFEGIAAGWGLDRAELSALVSAREITTVEILESDAPEPWAAGVLIVLDPSTRRRLRASGQPSATRSDDDDVEESEPDFVDFSTAEEPPASEEKEPPPAAPVSLPRPAKSQTTTRRKRAAVMSRKGAAK